MLEKLIVSAPGKRSETPGCKPCKHPHANSWSGLCLGLLIRNQPRRSYWGYFLLFLSSSYSPNLALPIRAGISAIDNAGYTYYGTARLEWQLGECPRVAFQPPGSLCRLGDSAHARWDLGYPAGNISELAHILKLQRNITSIPLTVALSSPFTTTIHPERGHPMKYGKHTAWTTSPMRASLRSGSWKR